MEWTHGPTKWIIAARFYSFFSRLSVIQVYAPHNERDKEEKDHLYEELQQQILEKETVRDTSYIGRHGMEGKNDNGSGTLFQHKDIHKAIWVSAKQFIDHSDQQAVEICTH